MNGLTIEIGNTDAEGRLTLADALAYAARETKPDEMIDLATLTGAVVIALGQGMSGVMATSDGLARASSPPPHAAGERMWRLPLFDEYKDGHQERRRRSQQRLEPARRGRHRRRALHARLHLGHAVGAPGHRGHGVRRAGRHSLGPKGGTGVGGAHRAEPPHPAPPAKSSA